MSCCNISCQKCPFSSAKKWHFERPNLRKDSKNHAKQPPKWFIRHLVHAFSIFGRVSSQFLKIMFLEAFWNCFTLLKGQKLETARRMPQKSFFVVAEMGCIYTGPNYIKRQSDSDNFLTFWYTLLCTFKQKFARTLCTFKQKLVHTMYV